MTKREIGVAELERLLNEAMNAVEGCDRLEIAINFSRDAPGNWDAALTRNRDIPDVCQAEFDTAKAKLKEQFVIRENMDR